MIAPNNLNQPAIVDALEKAVDFLEALCIALKSSASPLLVAPIDLSDIAIAAKKLKTERVDKNILASVEVARAVISCAKRPLMMDELYAGVRARGVFINTPNPKGTYGARLKRHGKRFNLTYKHGFGWWLAEMHYPPVNSLGSVG